MASLISCEIMKLKRSKILFISILGGFVSPLISIVAWFKMRADNPDFIVTFERMFNNVNLYNVILFDLVVFAVIAAYLFSREYSENTLKNLITIPITKDKLLMSKFIVLYIWMIVLVFMSWVAILIGGFIFGGTELTSSILLQSLWEYFLGTTLLFLTMSPFVLITLIFKNVIPTIIVAVAIALGNAIIMNDEFSKFYPWSANYWVLKFPVDYYPEVYTSIICVIITSIIGMVGSFIYFRRQDVK